MKDWLGVDLKHVWHPYTQMKEALRLRPVLIARAKGIKLYDAKGNFYYDTISSWWCNVHGHNHPRIKAAIKKQVDLLEHVLFAGFTHKPAIELSSKLIALTKNKFNRVFFSDNGSTSVEVALKMSFQYWQNIGRKRKAKFVSLDHGYHGDTIGTMSVSGLDLFNAVFSPLLFAAYKVPSPYCYRCPMKKERSTCVIDCIKPLERLLQEKHAEICALIIEPLVLGAAGMIIYPQEYLEKAAALAKKYKIHLILDEVAVGFGRTGKMFAYEHTPGIKADFLCLSKGITSGYLPLAVTLTTEEIFRAFYGDYEKRKTFFHGHTYTANPVSCSAGLASLSIFKEEKTLPKARKLMPFFHRELEKFRDLDLVGDVRYIGFIGAIELVKDKKTKQGFGLKRRLGLEVYKRGLKEHLVLRPLGDIIYLFLPLCTSQAEIKDILTRTYSVIKSLS
ncbi:MAG: adenosylmethionine--8-amino-7-oxononanoate transaminase [Candidatus Omnitrophica bacterium]|nr:adenosylmethionine--8-amino-7-oxononanoate transaminase [Candidatus Omnitrophota bacterium]MBU4303177.1 adenosylmethionine--8-amino-7-oxononanoate transaminase [Candidatus Omnitrophota bacterium]MBU4468124.1 adenosylmethionine--8-amino-7-oxononanoate transaminase [Candidatus Omnitrophota bacterium]MCG2708205.1 adenosylmethionine--8-amino-7-oxononanoate transaminase [Candidatus Omnitrophota bacterium]